MSPFSALTRLAAIAIAIAALFALPIGALAQSVPSRGPIAHADSAHKHARCHAKRHRRHKQRCAKKAHKASHKRAVSHASRHRHTSPPPPTPTSPTPAPTTTIVPAGPVQAPVLTITGTTYYVSASGSDANSGTGAGSAWRTVKRVNQASLRAGDGVLFEGGATFSDEILMPDVSGAPGSPIIFGSYGQGNATLPQGVWFRGHSHLAFEQLTMGPEGNFQGTGEDVTVEWCSIGHDSLAINATASNSGWTIDDNTIDHTGDSGMLLEGDHFTVAGNTITNTGLDSSIPYGKHGIYLKVSNATVTSNTIANFADDGISARYRNSVISGNHISAGSIGIGWFQYDAVAGTSHWTGNTITETTDSSVYVSPSDIGGQTRESFVITNNVFQKTSGTYLNLSPTLGTYTVAENTLA
jgi:hypothetical protein